MMGVFDQRWLAPIVRGVSTRREADLERRSGPRGAAP